MAMGHHLLLVCDYKLNSCHRHYMYFTSPNCMHSEISNTFFHMRLINKEYALIRQYALNNNQILWYADYSRPSTMLVINCQVGCYYYCDRFIRFGQ